MRGATFLFSAAVLVGLTGTNVQAEGPYPGGFEDGGIRIQTIGHPGRHYRHGDDYKVWHGGQGYSYGHHYNVLPCPPRRPSYMVPPVMVPYSGYPGYRHICGPNCGPRCRYAYPSHDFYYRGNGWGFSFGF